MSTEPLSQPFELKSPTRARRIVILCMPAWVAAFWSASVVITSHILPSLAKALITKPATYTVTVWTLLAPLCWIGAVVSAVRSGETTRFQKVLLTLSALAMLITWIAISRYMHRR
jgi:hypothetical protein